MKNRRNWLVALSMVVVGFVAGLLTARQRPRGHSRGAPPTVTGTRTLTMVTEWPEQLPGIGASATRLARRVAAASDGNLVIEVYPVGTKLEALASFDAVSEGQQAQLMHAAPLYWTSKAPAFGFFGATPFGMTSPELKAWIDHGGGQELWDELSARFNLKPFSAGSSGVQMGGWFNREINSAEDLKGLRMRIVGLGGETWTRAGGKAVALSGGEIFQALQRGDVDGAEWFGPWNDLSMGFYKVARYYYYPGFHEPGSNAELSFNLDTWQSLPPAHQEIIRSCIEAEASFVSAEYDARNAEALARLQRDHGVELNPFPRDAYRALALAAEEVLADLARTDSLSRKIHRNYIEFRAQAMGWTEVSEQAFASQRRLALGF